VLVRPTDRRTRPIAIPQDNVEDLEMLTPWLRSLRDQHTT